MFVIHSALEKSTNGEKWGQAPLLTSLLSSAFAGERLARLADDGSMGRAGPVFHRSLSERAVAWEHVSTACLGPFFLNVFSSGKFVISHVLAG